MPPVRRAPALAMTLRLPDAEVAKLGTFPDAAAVRTLLERSGFRMDAAGDFVPPVETWYDAMEGAMVYQQAFLSYATTSHE